jgi:hypothetical protein
MKADSRIVDPATGDILAAPDQALDAGRPGRRTATHSTRCSSGARASTGSRLPFTAWGR